jgi:phage-related protein
MNNYIILNGVSSTTINGLLIQSLPPISKPRIRTNVEEIDGRDGDIVTTLGYGAYDKEFKIGLYGSYDVNEIISYFNSQGTVTFSNEDDKYYNYQIIEQIDFDRLIRFKEATVKMHVQPFKYSAEENEKIFNINNNLLNFSNYSKTTNELTVAYSNGTLSVSGTGISNTEILIPITELTLENGSYTLNALAKGTNSNQCSIRLINNTISNSFGDDDITLANNQTESISATITEEESYNYVYFSINGGTAVNFTLDLQLVNNNSSGNILIRNVGNYFSRPTITIVGTGNIDLYLNNTQVFEINLGTYTSITIDTTNMNAYNGGTLLNRNITGNYDNFKLNVGNNTISWSGTVTQIEISNYSRWL